MGSASRYLSGPVTSAAPAGRDIHRFLRVMAIGGKASAGLLVVNFLLMVFRHEALHAVGVYVTGGMVTDVIWLPQPWTLAAVETVPPLMAGPVSYYLPLCLPYAVDFSLILTAPGLYRLPQTMIIKAAIFQQTVYFSALDILMNCTAGLLQPNDFTFIFSGWDIWRYPAILVIMALAVVLTYQRHRTRRADVLGTEGMKHTANDR